MKFSKRIVFVVIAIFTVGLFSIAIVSYTQKEIEVKKETAKREALYNQILEGSTTKPTTVSVDFSLSTAKGSPLVFGGSHHPNINHADAWNKIQNVGVTMIRTDLAMNYMIRNTTLQDYKSNKNDIQNIKNWNNIDLKKINNVFAEAHSRDMKTIGIMDYAPPWLTHDGSDFGVPTDWEVFEDIVKKTYKYHRNELDYVELWNEANHGHFLRPAGSGMSRAEAYEKIYYHAAKAIREVDAEANDGKIIPLGGPVDPSPNDTALLEPILKNEVTRRQVNFISYHNYYTAEPSWDKYKTLLKQYNMENYPIFITEWNIDGKNEVDDPKKTSVDAIIYTGNKLVDFLKMGLTGANYYSLQSIKEGSVYLGFYKWVNNKAELLPQGKTWMIMSRQMGLGKGESTIYPVLTEDKNLNSIGFINSTNERGVVLVNSSNEARMTSFKLENTRVAHTAKIKVYYASGIYDPAKPIYDGVIKATNGTIDLVLVIPKESVVGIKLTGDKEWFDFLNLTSN